MGAGFIRHLTVLIDRVDRALAVLCGIGLIAAAAVLTESVIVRYGLHRSTDWQDETAVFLLVGATFLSASRVQSMRGHIGIDAAAGLFGQRVDQIRHRLIDGASLLFVGFFAEKSWAMTHEAWVDGTVTSSTFAPPLWIPYGLMSVGMTLLTIRIFLQFAGPARKATE